MADDNTNLQNRLGNPSGPRAPNESQNNDPLAELARLIGQNDPFTDFGRDPRSAAPAQPPRAVPNEHPVVAPLQYEAHEQPPMPVAYQIPQPAPHMPASPPAFIQAPQDTAAYQDAAYRDSGEIAPGHDYFEENEQRGHGRRFGTATVVISLALLGTVGAIGYRTIFGSSGPATPPPVIRPNPEPAKVPPPTANVEPSQSKSTYDRVTGDRVAGDRVIAREETPVDIKDVARPGAGRNPPPPQQNAASPSNQWATAVAPSLPPTSSAAPSGNPPAAVMGEPKRVRTVTIKPDNADAGTAPATLGPPAPQAPPSSVTARPAPPQRTAVAVPSTAGTAPQSSTSRESMPVTRAPASNANAPLTLNDDSVLTLPRSLNEPPAAQQQRQVPVPQQRAAPAARAPTNLAAPVPAAPKQSPQVLAQAAAPRSGSYFVQLSSQRSEAEAQTALRGMQSRFSSVLGGQPSTVRRAELGERGVFYRAMVGPFASRDQATQLCSSLKAAGADCIVQSN